MRISGSSTSATKLPGETQNYVPEILAAIIIANHPAQYGFDDLTPDPPVLTDTVTVNYSVDLRLVSDLVGAPVDEIEALNPSLLHRVTPPDTAFDLHLPAGTADLFNKRIDLIPEDKRNAWRYHTVVAGDTLETVARRISGDQIGSWRQPTSWRPATALREWRRWWCQCRLRPFLSRMPGSTRCAGAIHW